MTRATQGPLRAVLVGAVRQLGLDARKARAQLDFQHPDRQFYLGVEAAADEILYPERGQARPQDWPDAMPTPFRDGYLRTTAMLAAAASAEIAPLRLRLPEPDPPLHRSSGERPKP